MARSGQNASVYRMLRYRSRLFETSNNENRNDERDPRLYVALVQASRSWQQGFVLSLTSAISLSDFVSLVVPGVCHCGP